MMHTASMKTPPTPKKPETVRVTVPVTQEVLESFQTLATASGMSTGKAMGTFLGDMIDSVHFLANKVNEARSAPKIVARELHAYALGLADETGDLMRKLAENGQADRTLTESEARPAAGRSAPFPPSSNTGGYLNKSTHIPKGSKS